MPRPDTGCKAGLALPFVIGMGRGWSSLLAVLVLAGPGCGRSPVLLAAQAGAHLDDDADDDDDAPAPTCDEVDVLFVIDDSPSMGDNQRKLAENYDVFVDGVTALVDNRTDVHLGVVTTDAYSHNVAGCRDLGDLVVQTGGYGSSDETCGPYAAGTNYITDADDVDAAFTCAARVGTSGATLEQPMTAAARAIGVESGAAGECNEGFVREDAMLVIVFVTDEDGEHEAELAYDRLMEARSGNENSVVVVTLANLPGGDCPLGNHAAIANELAALTEMFEFGFAGPVCAKDYTDVFRQAVDVVAAACSGA
ncbi:MAG TPA: hypothetical protein VFG69_03155 [Nannocystaceae bacterium]|nr:hypothetical protein [Nannocystaceae bacterium]